MLKKLIKEKEKLLEPVPVGDIGIMLYRVGDAAEQEVMDVCASLEDSMDELDSVHGKPAENATGEDTQGEGNYPDVFGLMSSF